VERARGDPRGELHLHELAEWWVVTCSGLIDPKYGARCRCQREWCIFQARVCAGLRSPRNPRRRVAPHVFLVRRAHACELRRGRVLRRGRGGCGADHRCVLPRGDDQGFSGEFIAPQKFIELFSDGFDAARRHRAVPDVSVGDDGRFGAPRVQIHRVSRFSPRGFPTCPPQNVREPVGGRWYGPLDPERRFVDSLWKLSRSRWGRHVGRC
jgi:hypothetical protein